MESMIYKLLCRKKTEPEKWIVKAVCCERWQAEKFMLNLETCSDMYSEMKIIETSNDTQEGNKNA